MPWPLLCPGTGRRQCSVCMCQLGPLLQYTAQPAQSSFLTGARGVLSSSRICVIEFCGFNYENVRIPVVPIWITAVGLNNECKSPFIIQKCQPFTGSNSLNMRIFWFSLFYIIVSGIFWCFGLLVGQNKRFEDITFGCGKLAVFSRHFFTVF